MRKEASPLPDHTAVCGTAGSFGAEREDLNKSAEVASCAPGNRTLELCPIL